MRVGKHNIHYIAQSQLATCELARRAVRRGTTRARLFFYRIAAQLVNFAGHSLRPRRSRQEDPLDVAFARVVTADAVAFARVLGPACLLTPGRIEGPARTCLSAVCELRARDAGLARATAASQLLVAGPQPFRMVDFYSAARRARLKALQQRVRYRR